MTKIMNYPTSSPSSVPPTIHALIPHRFRTESPCLLVPLHNIVKENNPYVWQARMTDDQSGLLLAKAATENLGMKNPAILYQTDSFGTGLKDQTLEALKTLGIDVPARNQYGFTNEEKNFISILSQIQNSLPSATRCPLPLSASRWTPWALTFRCLAPPLGPLPSAVRTQGQLPMVGTRLLTGQWK